MSFIGDFLYKKVDENPQEEKSLSAKIEELIIPAILSIISVVLVVFVLLPDLNDSITKYGQLNDTNNTISILQSNQTILNSMSMDTINSDLSLTAKIIPESLQVSDFAYYVDKTATQKYNLVSKELTASDISVSGTTTSFNEVLSQLAGVTSPLKYDGKFDDLVNFLDNLQYNTPYLVTTSNAVLKGSGDDQDRWTLEIQLTGFYLPISTATPAVTAPLNLYTASKTSLDQINTRVQTYGK